MKTKYKGAFLIPLIIGIAVTVIVVGILLCAFGGKGFGNGNGSIPVQQVISESIQPETETVEYINITVSGSDCIFQNMKMTPDEIITEIGNTEEKFAVKITDDGASIKAYNALVKALKDNNIRYIEQEGD